MYLSIFSRIRVSGGYLIKEYTNCLVLQNTQAVRIFCKFRLIVIKVCHGNIEHRVGDEPWISTIRRGNI